MLPKSRPVAEWQNLPAQFTSTNLFIGNHAVMMSWELPLMHAMADLLCAHTRGSILEVGFGMGISATRIQEHKPKRHLITEMHPQVIDVFNDWTSKFPDRDIQLIAGSWQSKIESLPKVDGIFFDPYSADEQSAKLEKSDFIELAAERLLDNGGALTFFHLSPNIGRDLQDIIYSHYSVMNTKAVEVTIPPGHICPEMNGKPYALAVLLVK